MKRYFLFVLFLLFLAGCKKEQSSEKDLAWEAIGDILFENGLSVSPLDPSIVHEKGGFEKANTDTLYFEKKNVLPIWQMAQWYSKYDIADALAKINADGSIEYSNEGKRIVRYRDNSLLLSITTSVEYDAPRKDGENWPHLLIEQSFMKKPNVGKVSKLLFSMSLKLEKCENKMGDNYNESFHTAQSPFYFILRNINEESEDYNKSIWLGIPSFDFRYPKLIAEEHVSWDIGTNMYIYNIPPKTIWGDISFHDRQWHGTEIDILPLLKTAVETMKSKDVFTKTNLSDLELIGMNFGWEVPGTFDAAIHMKGLSLKIYE